MKWASQPLLHLLLKYAGKAKLKIIIQKIMSMMNNIPAVNNKGASEAKIMALEQTVSRLDRIAKASVKPKG